MSGVGGEASAESFTAECVEDEQLRCARFLARFVIRVEEPSGE